MADTEYISKEAALACFSDWIDRYGHEHTADEMVEYQKIEDLPVADVVEIVRCKDCVHLDPDTGDCRNPFGIERPRPDNFCCNGRRRSNSDG